MQLPAYLALAVCAALTALPAGAQPIGRSPHSVFQAPMSPPPSQPPPGGRSQTIHNSYEAAAPPAPTGLALTSDQDLCAQHAGPAGRRYCFGLGRPGALALVWDGGGADGFQVYRIEGGRPSPFGPPSRPDFTAAILDTASADGDCYAVAAIVGGRQSRLSETVCPAPAASQRPRPDYAGAEGWPGPRRPFPNDANDQSPSPPPGHHPRQDFAGDAVEPQPPGSGRHPRQDFAGDAVEPQPPGSGRHPRQDFAGDEVQPQPPGPPPAPTVQKVAVPADQTCTSGVWPAGVFLGEYMRLGGPNGPMGCPLSGPSPITGVPGGLAMVFQNGQISTNDGVWPGGVVGAYQQGLTITVDWAVRYREAHPGYNYDKFNVRFTNLADPAHAQQHEVIAKMDRTGDTHLRSQGTYSTGWSGASTIVQVSVEGCDNPTGDISKPSPFNGRCLQGWMAPVNVIFHSDPSQLPPDDTAFVNFALMGARQPTSVADSKAQFGRRAAAGILPAACSLFDYAGYNNEESYRQSMLAKMLYADYFDADHCPGRKDVNGYISNRQEVYDSLMTQTLLGDEQTGSSFDGVSPPKGFGIDNLCGDDNAGCPPYRKGEWDVLMVGYAGVLSRYGAVMPPEVYHHVLYDLMIKSGPPNPADQQINVLGVVNDETENHQLNIFTSQYLANQLRYRDTGDARYDNARNGMNPFMANFLHQLLSRDFLEYNARPYQDYSIVAVSFLYSFASDANDAPPGGVSSHAVKLAARMVLDYVTAKMAVSSDDARRVAPYRRRADHGGDHDLLGGGADPQGPRVLQLAGVGIDQLNWPAPGMGISNYTLQMVDAAFSSYRPPDMILDEFVNRENRRSLEIFRHAGDEIYWKSTSYMLSAGGRHVDALYPHKLSDQDIAIFAGAVTASLNPPGIAALAVVGGASALVASSIKVADGDARGMALPTTLIPAAQVRSTDDMLRFLGDGDADQQSYRTNLCVSKAFACGQNLQIPPSYYADRACYVTGRVGTEGSSWQFFDRTGHCSPMRPYGYYVAVWSVKIGDRTDGLIEVYDRETSSSPVASTSLHDAESPLFEHGETGPRPQPAPGEITSFQAFIKDVVGRNETKPFSATGVNDGNNSYETAAGDRIAFQIGPESRIIGQSASGLVSGSFMNADGAGKVTITNTMVGEVLTLDDTDPAAPVRTLKGGPRAVLGSEKSEESRLPH
jgi:hypothetical protein